MCRDYRYVSSDTGGCRCCCSSSRMSPPSALSWGTSRPPRLSGSTTDAHGVCRPPPGASYVSYLDHSARCCSWMGSRDNGGASSRRCASRRRDHRRLSENQLGGNQLVRRRRSRCSSGIPCSGSNDTCRDPKRRWARPHNATRLTPRRCTCSGHQTLPEKPPRFHQHHLCPSLAALVEPTCSRAPRSLALGVRSKRLRQLGPDHRREVDPAPGKERVSPNAGSETRCSRSPNGA